MDLISGIASASMSLSSSQALTNVNIAVMGKALDTVREQEAVITEMIDSMVPASSQLLDVYA